MHEQPAPTLFLEDYRPPVDLANNVVYLNPVEPDDVADFKFTEIMKDDFFYWLQRVRQFTQAVAAGEMPEIGNGFRFVIDTSHPLDPIPADEYTAYFSRGEVPLAAVGHKEHEHDMGHGPNYQTLFGITSFAECVRTAATNALDQNLCDIFTRGMDGLGDNMRNLESGDYFDGMLRGATSRLQLLVELEITDSDPEAQAAKRAVRFDELWQTLNLPAYERRVAAETKRRQSMGDFIHLGGIVEL